MNIYTFDKCCFYLELKTGYKIWLFVDIFAILTLISVYEAATDMIFSPLLISPPFLVLMVDSIMLVNLMCPGNSRRRRKKRSGMPNMTSGPRTSRSSHNLFWFWLGFKVCISITLLKHCYHAYGIFCKLVSGYCALSLVIKIFSTCFNCVRT